MVKKKLGIIAILGMAYLCLNTPAIAACPIPVTLTNGQTADASDVMTDLNAVAACADAAVAPSGTPTAGEIAVFSGAKSVTGGDLSGDVTTSGTATTTLSSTGVTPGSYFNTNITVDAKGRITAAATGGGGGGGPTTPPTLRASSKTQNVGSTVTITLPTGSAVGDDCYIVASGGASPMGVGNGFAMLAAHAGAGNGIAVYYKRLVLADITAGNVTITYIASFQTQVQAFTFVGSTTGAYPKYTLVSNGALALLQNKIWMTPPPPTLSPGYYLLAALAARANSTSTLTEGTLLQGDQKTNGSLHSYSVPLVLSPGSPMTVNVTANGSSDVFMIYVFIAGT